jgi:capsular polysaccharide transport system permease protein
MTTKPKAKKFRIRRSPSAVGSPTARPDTATGTAQPSPAEPARTPSVRPGPDAAQARAAALALRAARAGSSAVQPERPAPDNVSRTEADTTAPEHRSADARTMRGEVSSARETTAETEIDAIRREGLTGRQLRMARRVAHQHNLPATSDFDAVRLLRKKGIDPFQRQNMLELVVPKDKGKTEDQQSDRVQLPQTVPQHNPNLPSTDLNPAERRNREIHEIQLDIARRRRRRLGMLLARLAFFVMLPTIIAGTYFYVIATPMYATKSEFLILKADNAGGAGLGGLLSGTQFATSQDSIAVQSYLQSKDAMLRLDGDVGFKSHFVQDWIDPIQRLGENPTNEEAYKTYSKNVKIGYDPTEGVLRMEVTAADPLVAAQFSEKLISYAEARVNHLSEQKRDDQMQDAMGGFESAQTERRKAQEALVTLQQQGAILDPESVIAGLRSRINTVELELQDKELQLAALMDNLRPNKAKVDGAQGDVSRLKSLLADLNRQMIDASKGENSLASLSVRIQMAQADLATRDMMLQSALQQVEQTRMEANRQVRYLTTSVEPVASQEASYPRKFENTILAFLIFSGIYLMISLTASILREQVSS